MGLVAAAASALVQPYGVSLPWGPFTARLGIIQAVEMHHASAGLAVDVLRPLLKRSFSHPPVRDEDDGGDEDEEDVTMGDEEEEKEENDGHHSSAARGARESMDAASGGRGQEGALGEGMVE